MPTPIEILMDPISLIVIAMFALLFLWETILPGHRQEQIRFWRIKGAIAFIIYFYLSSYLPLLWDGWLSQYQLFDLTGLGTLGGAAIGVLLYEFGVYVWHRAMHTNNVLWRTFHQMHHSAERLDMAGAFYFSPMDMIGFTALGSLCLVLVVGLSPQAATVTLLTVTFLGMFQHANIKTPVWLGYIVQRPESHSVHHERGVHAYNYSDLPIFDIVFGTFRNPREYARKNGFYSGASSRVVDMLMFKDVSEE